ncbi:MAG TPA: M28 family peptidase [Candidatus Acidoferrales bacterium]|nr:M28 family peptidase [Candidatus Acidoferrales bacterium]
MELVDFHWIIKHPSKMFTGLLAISLAACAPAAAQLSPAEPDPLARIRDAAKTNVQACSATGENLCEQVAPKIIANAQGDSPLAENVRRLAQEIHNAKIDSPAETVTWALAAFRAAGLEPHTEENIVPVLGQEGATPVQEAVVAEFRGREKPEEWILLGARLDPQSPDTVNMACNAALVVEVARDIQLTSIRPRRSIRFVLFIGSDKNMLGSWAYVRAHRSELDRARAAIFFLGGADRMNGYMLGGRHDIEAGLREAMKPIESWGVGNNASGASIYSSDFDFLLEGVPTALANEGVRSARPVPIFSEALDHLDIQELKRNTAIAAVTLFGIAERAEPIGPRLSRGEIESLLKTTDLGEQMKTAGLWPFWESGQRGHLP